MPPTRTLQTLQLRFSPPAKLKKDETRGKPAVVPVVVATEDEVVDLADCNIEYPLDHKARRNFKTKDGKKLTAHQWAVYDFVRNIPVGQVTTYKNICVVLGQGSPRSVGAALRNNPFAPFVPCHRIIASNHYIGGFCGEWGPNVGTGKQYRRKIDMLAKEGVTFTDRGYLKGGETIIWKG